MRQIVLLVLFLTACGDNLVAPPDAPPPPPDAPEAPDFYGEACVQVPGSTTICHPNDKGWCIAGICRPMCSEPACPFGVERRAPEGGCYCEPAPDQT